jgi:hypothetical protein
MGSGFDGFVTFLFIQLPLTHLFFTSDCHKLPVNLGRDAECFLGVTVQVFLIVRVLAGRGAHFVGYSVQHLHIQLLDLETEEDRTEK